MGWSGTATWKSWFQWLLSWVMGHICFSFLSSSAAVRVDVKQGFWEMPSGVWTGSYDCGLGATPEVSCTFVTKWNVEHLSKVWNIQWSLHCEIYIHLVKCIQLSETFIICNENPVKHDSPWRQTKSGIFSYISLWSSLPPFQLHHDYTWTITKSIFVSPRHRWLWCYC